MAARDIVEVVAFGWFAGTLLVPKGAKTIGLLIMMAGGALAGHGERLERAYRAYTGR